MDEIIQTYYEAYKFKHPKEADFRRIVLEVLDKHELPMPFDITSYLDQCLHGVEICDFELESIEDNKVTVKQIGGMTIPVEVEVTYENGQTERQIWDGLGEEKAMEFSSESPIVSAHVDPDQKIYLDVNFTNNSKTLKPNIRPITKYATKSQNWMQTLIHFASYLM